MTTTRETQPTPDQHYRPELLDQIDRDAPIRTPSDALELAARMVQTAHTRQWWLLMLDEDGRVVPVIPQIEMPRRFGERDAEDAAAVLGQLRIDGCADIVLVWEQPDADDVDELPGPSLLHAALARRRQDLLAQVLVLPDFRVRIWEPPAAIDG